MSKKIDGWTGPSLYPQKLFGWRIFQVKNLTIKYDHFPPKELNILNAELPDIKVGWHLVPIGVSLNDAYPELHEGGWSPNAFCTTLPKFKKFNTYKLHQSPVENCQCGYWVIYNFMGLLHHSVSIQPLIDPDDFVIAYVETTGKVVITEQGFRAERIKVHGILDHKVHGILDHLEFGYTSQFSKPLSSPRSVLSEKERAKFPALQTYSFREALNLPTSHLRDFLPENEREHVNSSAIYCPCLVCYTYYRNWTDLLKAELKWTTFDK